MGNQNSKYANEPIVMLDVANIRPFEHNHRRPKNPLYAEIKDSVRVHGLKTPLVVTQRPKETFYVLMPGGDTRLQIL